jgi:hypothetical protein
LELRGTKNRRWICPDNFVEGKYMVRHLLPVRIAWKNIVIMITIYYTMLMYGMPVATIKHIECE